MSDVYFLYYSETDRETRKTAEKAIILTDHPLRWLAKMQREFPERSFRMVTHGKLKGSKSTIGKFKGLGLIQ